MIPEALPQPISQPMRKPRIAGASLNTTPLDWAGNLHQIRQAIDAARNEGVDVLLLPELSISGYGCEDAFLWPETAARAWHQLPEVALAAQGLTVVVGLPVRLHNNLFNMAAVLTNGQLHGLFAKSHLANDGVHYEKRWFRPWGDGQPGVENVLRGSLAQEGSFLPVNPAHNGDFNILEVNGLRLGAEICEDAWVQGRPALRMQAPDLILNPSASHFAYGKTHRRRNLVAESSRNYDCVYVYANLVGNEAGRIIYDGEVLIAQCGELLAAGKRFSFRRWGLTVTDVDLHLNGQSRVRRQTGPTVPHPVAAVSMAPRTEVSASKPPLKSLGGSVQPLPESKNEEFHKAITLGLWDYVRKSRSRGFVLSLSGGADSATCAVMAAEALRRAQDEVGNEEVTRLLGLPSGASVADIRRQWLTCIYQATANSSPETETSARELAAELGATWLRWDVEPLHQAYLELGHDSMGRPLNWEQDDLALQNIQSRLRAPGAWLIANVKGALLLTTGNRSEAAVGYATMDGDTAGSLAPLGGADKTFILSWLRWAEVELGYASLRYVNSLTPTAELRPAERSQTDEADLMPYPLLLAIEQAAIREGLSPLGVYHQLLPTWPADVLKTSIRRFFTLWARNQWKRERYAPSFHLDDYNLDPRSWCRFPILSGGFEQELAELDRVG